MTTATIPQTDTPSKGINPRPSPNAGNDGLVLRGVSWDTYERLVAEIENRGVRFTFDRGTLEIMSPLHLHEQYIALFNQFVIFYARNRGIRVHPTGSTTFKLKALECGIEPDSSFYVGDVTWLASRDTIDLSADPPPQLSIEVETTSSVSRRIGVYASLGIAELWRFDGDRLVFLGLTPEAKYVEIAESKQLPGLSAGGVCEWILKGRSMEFMAWIDAIEGWAGETKP